MSNWRLGAAALTASMTLLQASGAPAETRVGVTGAVNPSAAGTPPGAASRQLTVGTDIEFRERVVTTTDGQAQILFLDQSSLLIGPNSTVVIDEFVYDPATNKGNIAATLTQGSFRYIGGKLSKQGNATLNTPVATIGIRGSDITIDFDAVTRVMNVMTTTGTASLRTATDALNLRGGFGVTVSGTGLSVPTALTAARIATVNGQFEGLTGRTAGAAKPPTDGDVAKSGLSSTVEARNAASTEPGAGGAAGSSSLQTPFTPGPNDTQQTFVTTAPPPPPPPPPPSRTDRTLNGYATGLGIPTILVDEAGIVMNTTPTDLTIRTVPDATGPGRVSATFLYGPAPAGPASTERRLRSVGIELGDPPGSAPATHSVFTNDQVFQANQSVDRAGDKGLINGDPFTVSGVLVAVPMNTALGTFTGTTAGPACDCQFVNWGTWGANLRSTPSNTILHDVPLGFWVAGTLPDIRDQPIQGIATFSGSAIGNVLDNGVSRTASGAFTNTYNFSQRSGQLDIRNFDGTKSFGGTVTAPTDWRNYSGALSGSNLTGTANGSFYGTRNTANQVQLPAETAGNFEVSRSGYTAGGVFLGRR